ncbi:hypothetical protein ACF1BS_03315 [Streptomyces sp. NPDC014748]
MSDIARITSGICGIAGGGAGLVAASLVWRSRRVELVYLRAQFDLYKRP